MKIKLFNGGFTLLNLKVQAGGFDPSNGKVVLMVVGEGTQAGTVELEVTEARNLTAMFAGQLPEVTRVGSFADEASDAVASGLETTGRRSAAKGEAK